MALTKGSKVTFTVPLADGTSLEVQGTEPVPGLVLHHLLFFKKNKWQLSLKHCGCRVMGGFDTQKQALGALEAMTRFEVDWDQPCEGIKPQPDLAHAYVTGYRYLVGGAHEIA